MGQKKRKASQDQAAPLSKGECWYSGMNHKQLWAELAIPVFPHGAPQKKQKKNH